MFITRFAINGARRGAQKLLASPHAMHAAVLAGFPPDAATSTDAGRTLWRLDHRADHSVWLCVVSPARPDLTHLVEQAGWPTSRTWETRDYGPFLDRLQEGQEWLFRVVANPVYVRKSEEGIARRVGHSTASRQEEWLKDRVASHGFSITTTGSGQQDLLVTRRDKKRFRREGATVTLATAQFDGRLRVSDPKALRRALTHGIGPAKGYGCGLMTLALPRSVQVSADG